MFWLWFCLSDYAKFILGKLLLMHLSFNCLEIFKVQRHELMINPMILLFQVINMQIY